MRSLRIGIDVDGSVTEIIAPMVRFLRAQGIAVPPYEKTYDYDLSKVWGCSSEEGVRRVVSFYDSEEFRCLTPMACVPESFARLFPPHEGYLITARPTSVEHVTRSFFDNYLAGRCKEMYHLGEYIGNGPKQTKSRLALKLELDLFVEDALHQAEQIAAVGVPVLLMTQPWNKSASLSLGITRVDNWSDVVKYVEERTR